MANDTEIPPRPVEINGNIYCPKCQNPIGHYVLVENRVWLQVGGVQLEVARGRCCRCHTEYHWYTSDRLLEDLINRLVQKQKPVI